MQIVNAAETTFPNREILWFYHNNLFPKIYEFPTNITAFLESTREFYGNNHNKIYGNDNNQNHNKVI